MHLLGELAHKTWLRLEILLNDLDENDKERQAFIDDTRQFFDERLSTYEQRRHQLESRLNTLLEQIHQLCDELQQPRTLDDHSQMALSERERYFLAQIEQLKAKIFERDKELIKLREDIQNKAAFIGMIQIKTEQIKSTSEAHSILSDLNKQVRTLKEDLIHLIDQIRSLDPDALVEHSSIIQSFISVKDENQLSWLTKYQPWTGHSLHSHLRAEHERVHEILLAEVVRLRQELDQSEPLPPHDLRQELADLRLRQRYLCSLANFPHQLTSRSSLDEIRRTYDDLTASMRAQAREKLTRLWDLLDVPHDQRIIPKTVTNDDDYLAMNDEINQLEIYVESIRPLLTKIQKREWYKRQMVEFEKHAADPARLRGSSTQLLREERFRKDLSREFPKLTDDLRRTVAEWEESSGKKLIYGGEPYLETMNKEKLSVDFELLHLRLLTKCQLLVQPMKDETMSIAHTAQSPPPTPPPPSPSYRSATSGSTSRIPTMNFVNSNRKINRQS